jgi:uncharacterized protein (TIGR02266 family)
VASTEELRRTSIEAARDARELLAALHDGLAARSVAPIVGRLFAAEVGDAPKVYDVLDQSMSQLREVSKEHGDDERIVRIVSRAMALLHPVRSELGRALGKFRDDPTAPFLLTSARVKPDEPPEAERRADGRLEIEVDVGLEGDHIFFTGRTGDLSKGGLFVATDDPLPVDTDLVLSFILPDGYRVNAEATVAWVRVPRYRPNELPSGMGLRFMHLDPRDAHAIAFFLEVRPAFRYGD